MLVDDCRMKAKTFSGLRQIAFGDYGILDLGLIQGRAQSGGLHCGPGSRRDGGRVIAALLRERTTVLRNIDATEAASYPGHS